MPSQPESPDNQATRVEGLSNQEFLEQFAAPGRICLSGGTTLVDRAICRAERHLDPARKWGVWSHAFLFEGLRLDGRHWLIESDLQIHRKHIQLGVQENRVDKYFDEKLYPNLAVLDFGLTEEQTVCLLAEGLELVANHARYSLRELVGTFLALKNPDLRARANLLSRGNSLFCSAFVLLLFRKAGVDLAAGVDLKNTTPEDLARTSVPYQSWILKRAVAEPLRERLKARVKARLETGVGAKLQRLRQKRRIRKGLASLGNAAELEGY